MPKARLPKTANSASSSRTAIWRFKASPLRHGSDRHAGEGLRRGVPRWIPEISSYTLPEGFRVTSMKETYDLFKYGQVLWRGFNHEANGEGPFVFTARFRQGIRAAQRQFGYQDRGRRAKRRFRVLLRHVAGQPPVKAAWWSPSPPIRPTAGSALAAPPCWKACAAAKPSAPSAPSSAPRSSFTTASASAPTPPAHSGGGSSTRTCAYNHSPARRLRTVFRAREKFLKILTPPFPIGACATRPTIISGATGSENVRII